MTDVWRPATATTCDRPFELVEARAPTIDAPGYATFCLTRSTDAAAFVRALVPSKPMAARIFDGGQLRYADGRPLARTTTIAAGSELVLELRATREAGPASTSGAVVLYEDSFLLAAEKPAGILVHGDGTGSETLTDRVQGHLLREGSAAVPQALQRLDVDTSGIVLFSLTEELQPAFDSLVMGDGLRKRYYAMIEGSLPSHPDEWLEVEAPIARDRHDARRMRVGPTGKDAMTRFRTVATSGGHSLVEAELVTGRRHQIRVHLAHIGHPIVGDPLYGGSRAKGGLMLHAHEVRLTHPLTGEQLAIDSPLPPRFGLRDVG